MSKNVLTLVSALEAVRRTVLAAQQIQQAELRARLYPIYGEEAVDGSIEELIRRRVIRVIQNGSVIYLAIR